MAKGRGRSGRRRAVAEINVVPYIDVMLVLLIIFMVTAPMLQQGIEVDVPKTGGAKEVLDKGGPPLVISVDSRGKRYLNVLANPNAQVESDAEAIARIKLHLEKYPDSKMLVKGHLDAKYEDVVKAMNLLSEAGATKIGIVMELEQGQGK